MDRRRVAVVIPALNESATIGTVVAGASLFGTPVVVDDGSTDDTSERARAGGASVVRHDASRGYDGALNSGFLRAAELGCEFVVTMDADGQHDPEAIGAFIAALDQGADLVVGVRPSRPRIAETVFAWVTHWRWGLKDPLCGLKAYRIELWRALGHFDSYRSIGTELTLFAAVNRARITQIAVAGRERSGSPRFGRTFQANKQIIRALLLGLRIKAD